MPNGSRRMWGIGFSVTWPPRNAVRSPPHFATRACADSWQVVESRKTTYQSKPSTRKSGFMLEEGVPTAYGSGSPQPETLRQRPKFPMRFAFLLTCFVLIGPAQDPTFKTQAPLVVVPVTVSTTTGDRIWGLKDGDFQLL